VSTVFISALLLKERARWEHVVALPVVAAGMILMFLDELGGGRLLGNILAFLSAITFSFYFVFMRMQKDGSPLESVLLSHCLTAAICIVVSIFLPLPHVTSNALGAIAVLGTVQIGLSAILLSIAIKRVSAVQANLIAVIEPVFNPLWVFLAIGEAPGTTALIGGCIIIVAVTVTSIISARRKEEGEAELFRQGPA
jgi:drug/metabolite transporter (DMT)-like permease